MVAFATPDTDRIAHDARVDEMRADATLPDVGSSNVMSGFSGMNKALDQIRSQIQQLQSLRNISPATQYRKEQMLLAARDLEQSARKATQTNEYGKGVVIAENVYRLADRINGLLAQAA